jgi:hypothetical protein
MTIHVKFENLSAPVQIVQSEEVITTLEEGQSHTISTDDEHTLTVRKVPAVEETVAGGEPAAA